MRVRSVLALITVCLANPVGQRISAAQAQFTSSIRARVVDDFSHEGVSTVRVTLTGTEIREPIVAISDGQGNLRFTGLVSGRYSLAIDKAGYFPQSFPDIIVDGASAGNAADKNCFNRGTIQSKQESKCNGRQGLVRNCELGISDCGLLLG